MATYRDDYENLDSCLRSHDPLVRALAALSEEDVVLLMIALIRAERDKPCNA